MTALVINYTINPVWSIMKSISRGLIRSQMIIGYSRAASELARQGYHEESKQVMMKLTELRDDKTDS